MKCSSPPIRPMHTMMEKKPEGEYFKHGRRNSLPGLFPLDKSPFTMSPREKTESFRYV